MNPVVLLLLPAGFAAVYGLAWIERWAPSTRPIVAFFTVTAGLVAGLAWFDARRCRARVPVDFDEDPEPHTQRLGLRP